MTTLGEIGKRNQEITVIILQEKKMFVEFWEHKRKNITKIKKINVTLREAHHGCCFRFLFSSSSIPSFSSSFSSSPSHIFFFLVLHFLLTSLSLLFLPCLCPLLLPLSFYFYFASAPLLLSVLLLCFSFIFFWSSSSFYLLLIYSFLFPLLLHSPFFTNILILLYTVFFLLVTLVS